MAKPTTTAPTSEALELERPAEEHPLKAGSGAATWVDERIGAAGLGKFLLRKVFPDHWSFLLGEIALYSFIVLLLTGVFLTIWFKPSMAETEYTGTYQLLRGLQMSEAYASTLALSFDVRGGLLMRQVHHWAAMLFIGGMTVHMLRVFFTGAFRKPRELNWLIGVGLFALSLVEGFAGYSLPDDLLSGTGLRFVDGLMRSIPLVGTWAEFLVFGGEYPGTMIVPRLYMVHILLVPAILLALIGAHMALLVYHKHTQFAGPGRTEHNVVGYPLFPVYIAKMGGFFFIVFGILLLLGATMQINPVWMFGPYNPAQVTAGSQPDWYMGWVEGAVRIMPNWESHLWGTTWSWNIFLPAVCLMGLLFTVLGAWPFIEQWLTGDRAEHHLLDRPHNAPTRTALGVAGMTCYAMFWLSGGNDIIANMFHLSLNAITEFMRIAVFVMPVIAFIVTKRLCISLQRRDREEALHGSETGVISRAADGGYSEPHVPLHADEQYTLAAYPNREPLQLTTGTDADGVADKKNQVSGFRARMSRWFLSGYQPPVSQGDVDAAHHGHEDSTGLPAENAVEDPTLGERD